MKRKAWEDIAEQVNAVNCSNVMRSGEDVKKKWTCMSSESKNKLALNKREQRKTGKGSLPSNVSITPMDERIEGIICPTAITGDEGGKTCWTRPRHQPLITSPQMPLLLWKVQTMVSQIVLNSHN